MIVDAAINSGTSVTDYLNMSVGRFWDTWQAIRAVYERKANAAEQKRSGKVKPRKRKRR